MIVSINHTSKTYNWKRGENKGLHLQSPQFWSADKHDRSTGNCHFLFFSWVFLVDLEVTTCSALRVCKAIPFTSLVWFKRVDRRRGLTIPSTDCCSAGSASVPTEWLSVRRRFGKMPLPTLSDDDNENLLLLDTGPGLLETSEECCLEGDFVVLPLPSFVVMLLFVDIFFFDTIWPQLPCLSSTLCALTDFPSSEFDCEDFFPDETCFLSVFLK